MLHNGSGSVHVVAVPWGKGPFLFRGASARAFDAGLRPPLAIAYATNYRRPDRQTDIHRAFVLGLGARHRGIEELSEGG